MSGALDTRLCELVDVRYPIVQTGMGWVSGPRLTAASSQAGALGILAGGTMTLAELERAVNEVKERTDRPFGVNFRTDQPDVEDRVERSPATDKRRAPTSSAACGTAAW